MSSSAEFHGTTIVTVRRGNSVVMGGDGQVSLGNTVVKGNARKVRRLGGDSILAGFAGSTADAFTLLERLEAKLERHPGQLTRACVELAKDWRTERRWVVYAGDVELDGSMVPPGWHGWLGRSREKTPSEQPAVTKRWEKEHQPNLSGTPQAYVPAGHVQRGGQRAKATGDYEAWRP